MYLRYPILLLLAVAICLVVQALALRASGGRFTKSESNFFSSIGRIQAGAVGKPDVMLLGSSITGRLPDRANGFDGVVNMGCDGGSAVDVLRAMDQGILPIAPILVVEANTLFLALNGTHSEVGEAMESGWFRVGMNVPSLSAYARPSGYFYSLLLARKIGSFRQLGREEDLGVVSQPQRVLPTVSFKVSEPQNVLINEISGILERLRAKGCDISIVWLPPRRADERTPPAWILELARRSNTRYWDLGQDADPKAVTLTDGVHMSASSAARTVNSLRKGLAADARH